MNVFFIHQDGEHSVRQSSAPREVRARVCCWQVGHEGEAKMGRWCCVQKLLEGRIRQEGEDFHQWLLEKRISPKVYEQVHSVMRVRVSLGYLTTFWLNLFSYFQALLCWSILPIFLVSDKFKGRHFCCHGIQKEQIKQKQIYKMADFSCVKAEDLNKQLLNWICSDACFSKLWII